jgi:hypothetical protein
MLRIFENSVPGAFSSGIFALGFHVGAADLDGAELIRANAPVENLLLARFCIEEPSPILFYQWNWKPPQAIRLDAFIV